MCPQWSDFVAGGENIYEDLASTGTTTPAQTTYYVKKEKGFIMMRVLLQGTTTAERAIGTAKLIVDNAAAGAGYLGATVSGYVSGETGVGAVAGVLATELATADAADEWDIAKLQIYGYFKDAFIHETSDCNANLLLVGHASTANNLTEMVDANSHTQRACGVALEDASATTSFTATDIFLFAA